MLFLVSSLEKSGTLGGNVSLTHVSGNFFASGNTSDMLKIILMSTR